MKFLPPLLGHITLQVCLTDFDLSHLTCCSDLNVTKKGCNQRLTKFMSECACLLLLLSHYPENISNRLEKQGRVKSPQLSQLRLYYIGGKSENISRRGRSPGEGHGNPHQYSCLQNSMDREAWWAAVHRVAQSWLEMTEATQHSTRLSQISGKLENICN